MPKFIANLFALALLAGCAVGPDYSRPPTPQPAEFNATHTSGSFEETEAVFWQGFEDPLLESLIRETLFANQSLLSTMARYWRASALLDGARRDQLPSVTAEAAATEAWPSALERATTGANLERFETYQGNLVASWELDLFGRLRRISEARQADLAAQEADLQALRVAMVGQTASSYFLLRGLQTQHRIAEQNVALREDSLAIVNARVGAGRGTEFDRVRARAQLQRARAELPLLEADIQTTMHRIAVLTGQEPTALIAELSKAQPLPAVMPAIPVDSPADVLRRRPDIIAAEQRLAAATARVGVAVADLFPRFTLGGLLGSIAGDPDDLFSAPAESRSVMLGIDWTFLDYGKVQARIAAADAESLSLLFDYRQAVLTALEETESRLVQYDRIQAQRQHLEQATEEALQAVDLARLRYDGGFIAYIEVLDAEQELASARDAAVRSRTAEAVSMVDVYRTLAGAPAVPR